MLIDQVYVPYLCYTQVLVSPREIAAYYDRLAVEADSSNVSSQKDCFGIGGVA